MSDTVWVEVETHKHCGFIATYRGQMAADALERLRLGQIGSDFVHLTNTYWSNQASDDDETGEPRKKLQIMGRDYWSNFTGEILIRGDSIVTVALLRGGIEHED